MTSKLPPLYLDLPYQSDSAHYFEAVRHLPWPIFLDSANTQLETGRYDIIAADPFIKLETYGKSTKVSYRNGTIEQSSEDPFNLLQRLLKPLKHEACDLPFTGGAMGYFGYDLGRRLEAIPAQASDAENIPEMAVGIYDWVIVSDHQQQRCYLASFGFAPDTKDNWADLLHQVQNHSVGSDNATFAVTGELRANFDKQRYQQAFNKIKAYIVEGDCYQVNLAKRFEVSAEGDPWHAYKLLRQYNAAPFCAYFSTDTAAILSSSPERLLQVNGKRIETKPIKGTRPRDLNNSDRDQQLAIELQGSIKDHAENLMIVDLLRNDLGKVCVPGSISVPKPFELESFATVHHLVSTITGTLKDDEDPVSLLKACFPGGSITGAPKLRAMEIIEELEPHRRGVYCGSIAYIGFDGNMDSNITIRTMVYSDNRLRFWAGGGIVADSNIDAEHQEILDKAAPMFKLIEQLS
ncbi:aminodeoxychorismate synthase, component I [Methylophaga sp. 42_25_T18]|nr:aminodeoxychorismate synthase, component I [Methylophaga sp. 42_25_T18]OUR89236.1 aminodeoxychorismate synthase, component I [Methylophaga sp. 42_8_T64]